MQKIEIQLYATALDAVHALYQMCVANNGHLEAQVNESADPLLCWMLGEGGAIPYMGGQKIVSASDYRFWSRDDNPLSADWLDQQLSPTRQLNLSEFLSRSLPGINIDAALQKIAAVAASN